MGRTGSSEAVLASPAALSLGQRWTPLIVGAICLTPFAPLLAPDDRVIPDNIYCDYESFQLPVREFAREEFLAGRFPLWIPYLGCGMPLHAGQQASLCHPLLTPLVLALGANQGIKTCLFLHVAIAFAGAYVLARGLSISRWGASLAGAIVVWGAFGVLHLMEGHVTIWLAYAWVPWLFAALNRLLRGPSPRHCAALAMAIALMAIGGHPQVPYYAFLFAAIWGAGSIAMGAAASFRLRCIGWGAVATMCAALISGAQLLPAIELSHGGMPQSQRDTVEFASRYSLSPSDFARFMLPNAMGNTLCGLEPFDRDDFSHERIGYIGILPLGLVWLGLTRRSPRRWQWGALALSLFGITIALGSNTPLFEKFGEVFPASCFFGVTVGCYPWWRCFLRCWQGAGWTPGRTETRARQASGRGVASCSHAFCSP